MKTKLIWIFALAAVFGAAWFASHRGQSNSAADSSGRKALYYTCSMHPWVREHKPGPCPVCGMNLTPVYENAGGTAAETNSTSSSPGTVTLESESISVVNVQ